MGNPAVANKSVRVFCYFLIACGIVIRFYSVFDSNPAGNLWSDPQRHWEQGIDVLRSDPMSQIDPVIYQVYVGIIAKLSLGIPELVGFYTFLLSCLTPWVWYRFFRELQPDKTVALAGWAFFSVYPVWIGIYSYYMQETLMLPLLGASLYLTWRCRRKQTVSSFTLMVLVWVLAGLTRGICIPMAAVAVSWLWFCQSERTVKAVYSVIVLSLILGPLAIRSYNTMNILAPHGIGYLNVIYAQSGKKEILIDFERDGAVWTYGFASPSIGSTPLSPLSDWSSSREGQVRLAVDTRKGMQDWNAGMKSQQVSLQKYIWISGENLIYLFFGESWPDSNRETTLGNLNYHSRWLWSPLFIVCLIWAVARLRRREPVSMLPALIAVWLLFQVFLMISVNEGRYRFPLTGLLIGQVVFLVGTRKRKRNNTITVNETATA